MKKISLFVFFFALFFIYSCQKNIVIDKYFSVQNGEYIAKKFPAQSDFDLTINDIDGNGYVIRGGATSISILPSSEANYVLVGVKGKTGYFRVPTTITDTDNNINIYLIISQDLEDKEFTILVALSNDGSTVGEIKEIHVNTITIGTGKLQVSLNWDQENDIDLHLIEPDGEEIYYGCDKSSNGGKLDLDSNPDCDIDGVNNENIFYDDEATIEEGEYIVRVDMYANCSVTTNTKYSVVVRYEGNIISTIEGDNPFSGEFSPTEEDAGSAGSGVTIMKFNIGNVKNAQKAFKLTYPENKDNTKNALSPQKLR